MVDQNVFERLKELEYENAFLRSQLSDRLLTKFQWMILMTALGSIEHTALVGSWEPDVHITGEDEGYVQTLNTIVKLCKKAKEEVAKEKKNKACI